MSSQKVFILTLGCRLNQAESLKLKGLATEKGFTVVSNDCEADIFILNSCSVTDKAQRDTEKTLRKFHERWPEKTLVVIGCGARKEYEKYGEVVLNKEKMELFDKISKDKGEQKKEQKDYSVKTRLMYKVQDGCNNFCSYCIVPYLRGRESSLKAEDIVNELKGAEKDGFKEVVLCGVNIGRWGSDRNAGDVGSGGNDKTINSNERSDSTFPAKGLSLADLIEKILEKTTFPRIRLSSINPDDFSDDLVALWSRNDRLCPHFHISLQSGSDTVLERMGRKYNTHDYADLVAKLRKNIKDVMITTDIIVGFPGETEDEFAETVEFIKKMEFLKVHVFRYSPRYGTLASKMPDQVSEKIKKERAVKLQALESEIRQKILRGYIGKEVEVLFEQVRPLSSSGSTRGSVSSGFTPNYIKVSKKGDKSLENKVIKVKIRDAGKNELFSY